MEIKNRETAREFVAAWSEASPDRRRFYLVSALDGVRRALAIVRTYPARYPLRMALDYSAAIRVLRRALASSC